MHTFTNHDKVGGDFGKQITANFKKFSHVDIATGYFGVSQINKLKHEIINIAKRGHFRILIGMVLREGVGKEQEKVLNLLHKELRDINPQSGVYISLDPYHGKVYRFRVDNEEKIYVGSSNFSSSGFRTNYEFNCEVIDDASKLSVVEFVNFIFDESNEFSVPLDRVQLQIKGVIKSPAKKNKTLEKSSLDDFLIGYAEFPKLLPVSRLEIKIRADEQPKSSLNLYFDKGRKTKDGRYTPRPWYEVEVTTEKSDRKHEDYPRGDFVAYVNDSGKYYKIPMITASDDFKAITSKGNREILGEYIKGRLQDSGYLEKYQRITSENLLEYGSDVLVLEKISDGVYYMSF